jgi:hypothetical protein
MELLPILQEQPWFVHVATAIITLNVALSALAKVVEVLKAQEKLPWLAKVAVAVQKIVDVISANVAHKK